MPNSDMTPAALWAEITRLPRPCKPIDFPRKGSDGEPVCQLSLSVLTPSEQVQCASAAEAYVRAKMGAQKAEERGPGYHSVYNSAVAAEFLFHSCRSVNDSSLKFFPTAQAIRDFLTIEEVGVLYQAFEQVSAEFGPILSALSEVEMEAWLEKLAKGADSVSPFWRLSSGQKNELLMYSASQLLSLRKDKALLGMPVEQDTSSE